MILSNGQSVRTTELVQGSQTHLGGCVRIDQGFKGRRSHGGFQEEGALSEATEGEQNVGRWEEKGGVCCCCPGPGGQAEVCPGSFPPYSHWCALHMASRVTAQNSTLLFNGL